MQFAYDVVIIESHFSPPSRSSWCKFQCRQTTRSDRNRMLVGRIWSADFSDWQRFLSLSLSLLISSAKHRTFEAMPRRRSIVRPSVRIRTDILALKHLSRILGHCNNPALPFCLFCGRGIFSFSVLKHWLWCEKQEVLGCCNVLESYWRALERGYLIPNWLCRLRSFLPSWPAAIFARGNFCNWRVRPF